MSNVKTNSILTQAETLARGADSMFNSPSRGSMTLREVIDDIVSFTNKDLKDEYKIVIGTDSQENHNGVNFVSAVVVHRVGRGGRYFWRRLYKSSIKNLRLRIYEEANLSRALAEEVIELLAKSGGLPCSLEIHIDVEMNGPTKAMINEVVGMVRGSGFEVKTKPDAYGASNVADKYT